MAPILFSLLFHLFAIGVFWIVNAHKPQIAPANPESELVAQIFRSSQKQIVDISENAPQLPPDNARYLSEHNQRVRVEMQSQRKTPGLGKRGEGQEKKEQTEVRPKEELKSGLSLQEELAALQQQKSQPANAGGTAGETDYLPDVKFGDKTYLNAEAFKHTGYYVEIKRKIEITWNPQAVLRRATFNGLELRRGVLATHLGVSLYPDGSLEGLVVIKSSGLDVLDDEAVRAFRASSPFRTVPAELLTNERRLRFEFGFIVTI